jgi:hypothetical protein
MVSSDLSARVQNTVQRFQSQGIALEQWLQVTGQDPAQFVESMREQSPCARQARPRPARPRPGRVARRQRRRRQRRVRAHRPAGRPEGVGHPQGVRGRGRGQRADRPDPQAQGAGLADGARRSESTTRVGRSTAPCCSSSTTTTTTTITSTITTMAMARSRP